MQASRNQLISAAAVLVVLAIGGIAAFSFSGGPAGLQNTSLAIGGSFSLQDTNGKRVTEKDFLGKPLLVFFGYTSCPDFCPSALDRMATALDKLGPQADRLNAVFITFDPERDTPAVLAEYVKNFSPRIKGLTGSADEIAAAARAYRVYFKRTKDERSESGYSFDHTSLIYLMDAAGTYRQHFAPNDGPDPIAAGLKLLLESN
jgi:cytochrome oxidase Cu insertion factor (SCO1/SenC/PrrC family)